MRVINYNNLLHRQLIYIYFNINSVPKYRKNDCSIIFVHSVNQTLAIAVNTNIL